jgi:hypothetical protein
MSKIEQNLPAQPLSSWASQRSTDDYWDEECYGMSRREVVFLAFMEKLISTPDQFDCTISNKAAKAKAYTKQYFKTLEEWEDE